ncbi:AAA family ATPase [Rufibacter radiotolerans]|uniref:AAA family ATPase n=1 Tax=Rufibacter radiotolerans TaxID=1379910 RepID=UPI002935219F|nr:AAA family ATPase [Rufibacter radiotolerans]
MFHYKPHIMELRKANRQRSKIRLLLQSPSGGGKTMSALLIAKGITEGDWSKVAVIDTENHSADLYSDLGEYNVLNLAAPFTPESYIQAMQACEKEGIEVIILDSITHEWEYLLDFHASLPGNSFTAWSKVTPRHTAFIQHMLQSPCHIIATVRSKTEYAMAEKNGKQVPEKMGMKSVQRDGIDYEFTVVLELDLRHNAVASKDRTRLFMDKPPFRPSEDTGRQILSWCLDGSAEPTPLNDDQVRQEVSQCTNLNELSALFHRCSQPQKDSLVPLFKEQKQFIMKSSQLTDQLLNQTIHKNGSNANAR